MSVGKIKAGIKQATTMKGIPRVLMHLGIGFVLGVIVDLILQKLAWTFLPEDKPALNIGFPFFISHPEMTYLPWDDLLLLVITVVALFTKKFWLVIGFFLGWYISSDQNLYGALIAPFEPTPEPSV